MIKKKGVEDEKEMETGGNSGELDPSFRRDDEKEIENE